MNLEDKDKKDLGIKELSDLTSKSEKDALSNNNKKSKNESLGLDSSEKAKENNNQKSDFNKKTDSSSLTPGYEKKDNDMIDESLQQSKKSNSIKGQNINDKKLIDKEEDKSLDEFDNNYKKDSKEESVLDKAKSKVKDSKEFKELEKKKNELVKKGKKVGAEAGAAALQAAGVPKPLGKLATKVAINKSEKNLKKGAQKLRNNKTAQRIKENIDNSPTAQKIKEKTSETIEKGTKAYKTYQRIKFMTMVANTAPFWGPIVAGVAVMFIILSLILGVLPGSYGNNIDDYSKKDQQLLNKISVASKANPNANAALGLAIIYYPHNEFFYSSETMYLMGYEKKAGDEEEISDKKLEDAMDDLEKQDDKDDDSDELPDINLKLLSKHFKAYEKLLPNLTKDSDANIEYIKATYFTENKYYKKMLKNLDTSRGTEDELKDYIIADIIESEPYFYNYVIDSGGTCSGEYTESGTITFDEKTVNNLYVQLVANDCSGTKGIHSCSDIIGSPLSLKDYVLGVTYAEIGLSSTLSIESIKAQIVAAKSFAVGRSKAMGRDYISQADGTYLIYMRNGTNDQVYCSITDGCTKYMTKPSLSQEMIDKISLAYDETSNEYIYDDKNDTFVAPYCNSYGECNFCPKAGNCMSQEEAIQGGYEGKKYKELLGYFYSDFQMLDVSTKVISSSTVICGGSEQKQYSGEYSGEYPMFPAGTKIRITSPCTTCRLHPRTKKYTAHAAVDLASPPGVDFWGTPVTPIKEGVVEAAFNKACGNNHVRIKHTAPNGTVYHTYYVHLNKNSHASALNLTVGSPVTKNTILGYVGGYSHEDDCSTGPHLHFAVQDEKRRPYDTLPALTTILNDEYDFSNIDIIKTNCK